MWTKKNMAAALTLVAILTGCFFMPDYSAGISDRTMLDQLSVIDAASISLDKTPDLGLPERLALIADYRAESLTIKNGKTLSVGGARTKAVSELRKFFGGELLEFDFIGFSVDDCYAEFVINAENASDTMIVWQLRLSDSEGRTISVTIDDDTGVILQLIYRRTKLSVLTDMIEADKKGDPLREEAERLNELISEYYGYPATLDYKLSGGIGYYKAELIIGEETVPLFGNIRELSFTINERHSL